MLQGQTQRLPMLRTALPPNVYLSATSASPQRAARGAVQAVGGAAGSGPGGGRAVCGGHGALGLGWMNWVCAGDVRGWQPCNVSACPEWRGAVNNGECSANAPRPPLTNAALLPCRIGTRPMGSRRCRAAGAMRGRSCSQETRASHMTPRGGLLVPQAWSCVVMLQLIRNTSQGICLVLLMLRPAHQASRSCNTRALPCASHHRAATPCSSPATASAGGWTAPSAGCAAGGCRGRSWWGASRCRASALKAAPSCRRTTLACCCSCARRRPGCTCAAVVSGMVCSARRRQSRAAECMESMGMAAVALIGCGGSRGGHQGTTSAVGRSLHPHPASCGSHHCLSKQPGRACAPFRAMVARRLAFALWASCVLLAAPSGECGRW